MDHGDPLTEGAFPEDGDDELAGDLPLRGWVDPDDRLWLHPSEVAKLPVGDTPAGGARHDAPGAVDDALMHAMASASADSPSRPGRPTDLRPRSGWALAGAALVAAVVAAAVIRLPAPSGPTSLPAATTSLTTAVVPAAAVREVARRLGSSLVGLVVARGRTRTMVTGAVIRPGDLAVTGLSAVRDASVVTAVASSGRRLAASLVGTDPTTGVAVVKLAGSLPPAQIADDLDPGQLAMTECLCARAPADPARPAAAVGMARVQAVGVRPTGPTHVLDAVEVDGTRRDAIGSVLADGHGHVAGILDGRAADGHSLVDVFVPGWLAADVAEQLATTHQVVHGWLGVTGQDRHGGCGAHVLQTVPGTPAAQVLSPGDVVVAVDGRQVCTWAQLQAALYVMRPDQSVQLRIDGPNGPATVDVALSGSPG